MRASWALDWRHGNCGGRHYDQVFSRALATRHAGQYVGWGQYGKDEAPVALLVFAVPAMIAIVIWWRFSAY
jgi:hypothetical protein